MTPTLPPCWHTTGAEHITRRQAHVTARDINRRHRTRRHAIPVLCGCGRWAITTSPAEARATRAARRQARRARP